MMIIVTFVMKMMVTMAAIRTMLAMIGIMVMMATYGNDGHGDDCLASGNGNDDCKYRL